MPEATAAAMLLTFRQLDGEQVEELTPLCLDLAVAIDEAEPVAAMYVGKAACGRPSSLRRLGFTMSDGYADDPYATTVAVLRDRVGGYREGWGSDA